MIAKTRSEYIEGWTEFCGRKFKVDQRVLVPRAKTQTTARIAAACVQKLSSLEGSKLTFVDVGTGSGAILLTVVLENKGSNIEYYGTDISADALDVARANSELYNQGDQIYFHVGNLLDGLPVSPDVIVANLPYIPHGSVVPPEVECEPVEAVFDAGDGTLLITTLLHQINNYEMMPKAFITETAPENIDKLIELIQKTMRVPPTDIRVHQDHEGFRRVLEVVWV